MQHLHWVLFSLCCPSQFLQGSAENIYPLAPVSASGAARKSISKENLCFATVADWKKSVDAFRLSSKWCTGLCGFPSWLLSCALQLAGGGECGDRDGAVLAFSLCLMLQLPAEPESHSQRAMALCSMYLCGLGCAGFPMSERSDSVTGDHWRSPSMWLGSQVMLKDQVTSPGSTEMAHVCTWSQL